MLRIVHDKIKSFPTPTIQVPMEVFGLSLTPEGYFQMGRIQWTKTNLWVINFKGEIKDASRRSSIFLFTPDTKMSMSFGEKLQLDHILEGLASTEKCKGLLQNRTHPPRPFWSLGNSGKKGKAVLPQNCVWLW